MCVKVAAPCSAQRQVTVVSSARTARCRVPRSRLSAVAVSEAVAAESRPGGSPPTSPSCRSCCGSRELRTCSRRPIIPRPLGRGIVMTEVPAWSPMFTGGSSDRHTLASFNTPVLNDREEAMIRTIAVAVFGLALASAVQAMPLAPIHQSNESIITVREACGAGMHMVNGVCIRTPARRAASRCARGVTC